MTCTVHVYLTQRDHTLCVNFLNGDGTPEELERAAIARFGPCSLSDVRTWPVGTTPKAALKLAALPPPQGGD